MGRTVTVSLPCLDGMLRAEATVLDGGLHLLVTGGCLTHAGAVSMAEPDGTLRNLQRPGHKDLAVSDLFALELAGQLHLSVCAVCGIHYDRITRAGIDEVMNTCRSLLALLIAELKR